MSLIYPTTIGRPDIRHFCFNHKCILYMQQLTNAFTEGKHFIVFKFLYNAMWSYFIFHDDYHYYYVIIYIYIYMNKYPGNSYWIFPCCQSHWCHISLLVFSYLRPVPREPYDPSHCTFKGAQKAKQRQVLEEEWKSPDQGLSQRCGNSHQNVFTSVEFRNQLGEFRIFSVQLPCVT